MSQEISESGTEFKVGKFQAYFTLVVCCLLFLINFMDRQLFSVVLEPMKKDLGLTDWQVD